jgi:hypothetical protein
MKLRIEKNRNKKKKKKFRNFSSTVSSNRSIHIRRQKKIKFQKNVFFCSCFLIEDSDHFDILRLIMKNEAL